MKSKASNRRAAACTVTLFLTILTVCVCVCALDYTSTSSIYTPITSFTFTYQRLTVNAFVRLALSPTCGLQESSHACQNVPFIKHKGKLAHLLIWHSYQKSTWEKCLGMKVMCLTVSALWLAKKCGLKCDQNYYHVLITPQCKCTFCWLMVLFSAFSCQSDLWFGANEH